MAKADLDMKRLRALKSRATDLAVFDQDEALSAVRSLGYAVSGIPGTLPWEEYKDFIKKYAHQSLKELSEMEAAAKELMQTFLNPLTDPDQFREIFQRVYEEGGFYRALCYAQEERKRTKPWVVVVAGVNGIRKTTCMYQTWIKEVIHDALKEVPQCYDVPKVEELPDGLNSFFRQLDHLIATVASQDFKALYNVRELEEYTAIKDGIFSRYRKMADIFGVAMIEDIKKYKTNVLIETTGQNNGQLVYVDHFFPKEKFNKLFLHFKVNDISLAEQTVDDRMLSEMEAGYQLMNGSNSSCSVKDIINVNKGGGQNSKVLGKVQEDSDKTWNKLLQGEYARDWFKASITVKAHKSKPWTASATSSNADVRSYPILRV